jgi:hypothetical protein
MSITIAALGVRLEGITNTLSLIAEQAPEADGEKLMTALSFIVDELLRFSDEMCSLPEAKEASND